MFRLRHHECFAASGPWSLLLFSVYLSKRTVSRFNVCETHAQSALYGSL